jgi:hypothetical protein
MTRPLIFDATALMASSGFKEAARFEAALAHALTASSSQPFHAVTIGERGVTAVPQVRFKARLNELLGGSGEDDSDFDAVRAWLLGQVDAGHPRAPRKANWIERGKARLKAVALQATAAPALPAEGIFLKAGLGGWDQLRLQAWLDARPGLVPIGIASHVWALDFPEYALVPEAKALPGSLAALARTIKHLVVPTEAARMRVQAALGGVGLSLSVLPLPSALAGSIPLPDDPKLAAMSYMVVAGPIEARSNILLLLCLWRDLIRAGRPVPKLVLAGERGAQIQEIRPLLDWNETNRPFVREVAGLNPSGLRTLVRHARAVLAPDFAGDSGAFARDAVALDTPVLASDIPVFREVLRDASTLLAPINGPGWRDSILQLAAADSGRSAQVEALPDWKAYAEGLLRLTS